MTSLCAPRRAPDLPKHLRWLLAAAPAFLAAHEATAQQAMPATEKTELAAVMHRIRTDYIDPIPPGGLSLSCRMGMLRLESSDARPPVRSVVEKPATDEVAQIDKTYARVRERTAGKYTGNQVFAACMHGMLDSLTQSAYLDREDMAALLAEGAIGVELRPEGGRPIVTRVADGSPAANAGIEAGDVIVAIDGQSTAGMSFAQASNRLRGATGTRVAVKVVHGGPGGPVEASMTLAKIEPRPVVSKLVAPGIGYLRVPQFIADTTEKVAASLTTLETLGATDGLVLDLRGNDGGLLDAGIALAALFLPDDAAIMRAAKRNKDDGENFSANPASYANGGAFDLRAIVPKRMRELPLAVLVDRGSSSVTEVVAAALQDQKRAVVMGERTPGNGTLSTVLPLNRGSAVKLATARMLRPSGKPIENEGVTPDRPADAVRPNASTSKDIAPEDDPLVQAAVRELGAVR